VCDAQRAIDVGHFIFLCIGSSGERLIFQKQQKEMNADGEMRLVEEKLLRTGDLEMGEQADADASR